MEQFPRFPAEAGPTGSPDIKTRRKSKDKKRYSIRFGVAEIDARGQTQPAEAPRSIAQAYQEAVPMLSELPAEAEAVAKKKKRSKKKTAYSVAETATADPAANADALATAEKESETSSNLAGANEAETFRTKEDEGGYQQFLEQIQPPHDTLGGGEVIVDLSSYRNKGTARMHDVPLRLGGKTPKPEQHQLRVEDKPVLEPERLAEYPSAGQSQEVVSKSQEFVRPHEAMVPHEPEFTRQESERAYVSNLPPLSPDAARPPAEQLAINHEGNKVVNEGQESGPGIGLRIGEAIAYYEHRKQKNRDKKLEKARAGYQFGAVARQERFSVPRPESVSPSNPERSQVVDGRIVVPEGQRLIREGAFIAQVEKATGKLVEKPSFEYGHEYYRERAQETMPLAQAQRNAGAGQLALAAASMDDAQQREDTGATTASGSGVTGVGKSVDGAGTGGSLPSPSAVPSATTQVALPTSSTQPIQPRPAPMQRDLSGQIPKEQPLWPWLLALAAVIICLIALFR